MTRGLLRSGVLVAAGAVVLSSAPLAAAAPAAQLPPADVAAEVCAARSNDSHAALAECVTLDAVRGHQLALQRVADAHGGTRVSGTEGHDASVAYVVDTLRRAGYAPTVQPVTYRTFANRRPPLLERVEPSAATLPTTVLEHSGSGDVTAPATTVPVDATPGCEAPDYDAFVQGTVAVVARGGCTFATKARLAQAAGAAAVVIANDRTGVLDATLGPEPGVDVPVVAVTQAVGRQLATTPNLVLHVRTATVRGPVTAANVVAERPGRPGAPVVMAGAHLDSDDSGPGLNDNGSGAAALLAVAEQMGGVQPENTVRFAWWGAREAPVRGSTRYLEGLAPAEVDRIALYLDVDVIGSPNHVFFVSDGDDSDRIGAGPGPEGSARIEKTFEAFYAQRGIPAKGADLTGRSDDGAFMARGIPTGGITTGTDGVKTVEEAARWGGTAGIPYDPCHRQACDDADNRDDEALDVNADAVAFAVLQYAMNTVDVTGVPGRDDFPPVSPPAAPAP
ncbi:M28 family peptidase [Oryzobacter sp. R7]|uniref:M28 family peptidase n=1 Tax=Oryzobacter faecalis TaxID=3388656 RepID=UPI00398D0878